MDWENSYFTMSDENNYTIWSFKKLLRMVKYIEELILYHGLDVQGHHILKWKLLRDEN